MSAQVNIGLLTWDGDAVDTLYALESLARHTDILAYRVAQSNTEQTLVALISVPLTSEQGNAISEELRQDCIAQLPEIGEGELIGPRAALWGAFNPEYFIPLFENS